MNCYHEYIDQNPDYRKTLTKAANEKSRKLGSLGLHWCQQDTEKARLQHQRWREKGNEKVRELVEQNEFWSQKDKAKLNKAMEKIHTPSAHQKLSNSLKGRKLTDEHRLKISKVRIEKGLSKGKNNPMYGKSPKNTKGFKSGFRKDIGHYVRSSWEANFARILQYLNKNYKFEPDVFELIDKDKNELTYRPDFKVGDKYYEVKGFWYDDAKEKFELFKQQYPEIEIEVINNEKYKKLKNAYKDKIKEWE